MALKSSKSIILNKGKGVKRRHSRTKKGDGNQKNIERMLLLYFYSKGGITFLTTPAIFFFSIDQE